MCYFVHINSSFYKKNNLDETRLHNGLEYDISSLRNEGSILLMVDFNV